MSATWVQESTLPYNFSHGSAVVFNDKIHIFGSSYDAAYYSNHYSWDGTSWTKESDIPYSYFVGDAVVYNNKIHLIGGGGYQGVANYTHYSWDGTTWVNESTLPYAYYAGTAVVYNNKIHIFGGNNSKKKHSSWNGGSTWTDEGDMDYNLSYRGLALVYNNKVHIFGLINPSDTTIGMHYSWDGSNYTYEDDLSFEFKSGCGCVGDNKIHIFCQKTTTLGVYQTWEDGVYTDDTPPYDRLYNAQAVVYDNKIHVLGGANNTTNTKHYSLELPPPPVPPEEKKLKVLDLYGTAYVANKVNEKLKTVTTMPNNPTNGLTVLYIGANTSSYTSGVIYTYSSSANKWIGKGFSPIIENTGLIFNL